MKPPVRWFPTANRLVLSTRNRTVYYRARAKTAKHSGGRYCVTEILGNGGGAIIRKLHGGTNFKFGQLILRKIIKIVASCHQMSHFQAKMHDSPNSMSAGAGAPVSRPCWGSLQRSPDLLTAFKGGAVLLIRGWDGKERDEREMGWGRK